MLTPTNCSAENRTDEDLIFLVNNLLSQIDVELDSVLDRRAPGEMGGDARELPARWLRVSRISSDLRLILKVLHGITERFLVSPPCAATCDAPCAGAPTFRRLRPGGSAPHSHS